VTYTWQYGLYQMRPALFGWQWRIRAYGSPLWEPWQFRFGTRERVRVAIELELGPGFVEATE
jgi:hypothetical protein